jgi:hypothetical protein
MDKFWMVYRADGKVPQQKHATKSDAIAEAKRLARGNQQASFVVLEAVEAYCIPIQEPERVELVGGEAMETKTIKLKIQCALDRNAMVTALANSGYKVWVEKEPIDKHFSWKGSDYYVCFELKVGK